MEQLMQWKKAVFPDLLEKMAQRYNVLYTISLHEPVGRRAIVDRLRLPERLIRNELDTLQQLGFVTSSTKGMLMTAEGKDAIIQLHDYVRQLSGLTMLEQHLQEKLSLKKVIVVAGNSDEDMFVKQEIGRAAVHYLQTIIHEDVSIAVTGGTTMAAIAEAMVPFDTYRCLFLPARGGVGEKVENQANMIAAKMAEKEKGTYRLLHVPDPMSETLYQSFVNEPSVQETVQLIQKANIVIHGIGQALTMAKRRQTEDTVINMLEEKDALSEAFGYYFDKKGNVVHKVRTIGLQLEDLTDDKHVISVAGGCEKADAIVSYVQKKKTDVLITDEAAAKEILNINNEILRRK